MSLRFRLNVLISVMFVTILVLGTMLVIFSARRAVFDETQSTAALALQLIEVAYSDAGPADGAELAARLRAELGSLESARHLDVLLVANGRETPLTGHEAAAVRAPGWFTGLVAPAAAELRRPFRGGAELLIRADPGDEIAESWDDAWPLLLLVLGVSIVANGLLYVVIGRWLEPVDRIVGAMDGIEQGDYRARLPAFELPELDTVAAKFNRMAEVLERSREQNRYLAQQTIAIQEDERRALAHELHDELGQSLTAITALAGSLEARGAPGGAAATITEVAGRMHGVVRGMLRRLRPVLLDEFGLVRAIEDLVDGWNDRHADSFCRLSVRGRFDGLGDATSIGLYRIVQEALTNASKHAAASQVDVTLEREEHGGVRLRIADNGVGFEPARAQLGLGLLGMRERAEALGGAFALDASPGGGAALTIALPRG